MKEKPLLKRISLNDISIIGIFLDLLIPSQKQKDKFVIIEFFLHIFLALEVLIREDLNYP